MNMRKVALGLLLATKTVTAGPGDPVEPKETYDAMAKEIDDVAQSHQLPEIPATFALGLGTTAIQRPGTMADFAAALVNSFNGDSSLKTGIAIEFSPFRLWRTNQFTAEQWSAGGVGSGWALLDSLALSIATADGGTDATGMKKPTLSSIGLRADLYNSTDLRKSKAYYDCAAKALKTIQKQETPAPPVLGEDPTRIAVSPSSAIDKCQEAHRGGLIAEVAAALVGSGDPAMGTSKLDGFRTWLLLGAAISSVDLTVEGDVHQHDEDHVRRDYFAGGRADVASPGPNRIGLGLEAYYANTDAAGSTSRTRRLGLGASIDLKLSSGLVLSAGAQGRTDLSSDFTLIVLTKLSFVLGSKTTDLYTSYRQLLP